MKSIPPLVAGAILLACSAVASAQATLYGRENFRGRAIVVDQDIDIHNDAEVLWAIATRTQPDRSTFFVQDAAVSRLDSASYSIWSRWEKDTMNTKWAIDATMPVEAPFEARADVPRQIWENLDLSKYIVPGRL